MKFRIVIFYKGIPIAKGNVLNIRPTGHDLMAFTDDFVEWNDNYDVKVEEVRQ